MQFEILKGKTLTEISGEIGGDTITFTDSDGIRYQLYHDQDCCEHVYVQDIIGDLADLIGSPILLAEEYSNEEELSEDQHSIAQESDGSHTWTFYKIATVKGYVTIRFLGTSNGYYSESVSFSTL